MPIEVKRDRGRKKVRLPSGQKCDIPVLIKLTFIDQNGQEIEHHAQNLAQDANREVHVDKVVSSHDSSASIDVERIDVWKVKDIPDRAQESNFELDNKTGADDHPPHFIGHQATHVVRYYQDPNNHDDNGVWIDSELIDEIDVVDQNGQEWRWILENPQRGDAEAQANPDDPDLTDTANGLDPPWRTDPYQNIIDFNDHPTTGALPELVGVLIGGAVRAQGIFGVFSIFGGLTEAAEGGTVELRAGLFNHTTNEWNFGSFPSLTGELSTPPPNQGSGNVPVGSHTGPFVFNYSLTATGIGEFSLNDSGGLWIGPYGPIDYSGLSFDAAGRHYTFDSILPGEADLNGQTFGVILSFLIP